METRTQSSGHWRVCHPRPGQNLTEFTVGPPGPGLAGEIRGKLGGSGEGWAWGPPKSPPESPGRSSGVGALAVRHGVQAFPFLVFRHAQPDCEVGDLVRDKGDGG